MELSEGDVEEGIRLARVAVRHAKALQHRVLQALARYQLLKALCTGQARDEAQRLLIKTRKELPFADLTMWRHVASNVDHRDRKARPLKPFAAFPF